MDPIEHEDNCQCMEEGYEWYILISHLLPCIRSNVSFASNYNFVRDGRDCVPVGPAPILAGICTGNPDQPYKGSSGWRKISGNTCGDGVKKDEKDDKKCS